MRKTKTLNKYLTPPVMLFGIAVVVVLGQGVVNYQFMQEHKDLKRQIRAESGRQSNHNFRMLAKEAAQLVYLPVVASAQDMYVYIPELRIRMPLTTESRKLTYSATDAKQGSVSHSYAYEAFNNQGALEKLECGRVAEVTFAPSAELAEDRTLQTVQLSDGRLMHAYLVDKDYCDSFVARSFVDEVEDALIQAQAY